MHAHQARAVIPVFGMKKLDPSSFYGNYHGHTIPHLGAILPILRGGQARPIIWLAGDSSLDNKAWLLNSAASPAKNGYELCLDPPVAVPDVAHCINSELISMPPRAKQIPAIDLVAINCAIEESTIGDRRSDLREQDKFIRDNLQANDILIISCGGNDIALRPTLTTMAQMARLIYGASDESIQHGQPGGLSYFMKMFKDDVAAYATALCSKTKPKLVVPCMIYFPHQHKIGSWADTALTSLQYDTHPSKLQHMIRRVYVDGTSQIRLSGVHTVPCPFFEALDPSPSSQDYVARVEPSVEGGKKMAKQLLAIIAQEYGRGQTCQPHLTDLGCPNGQIDDKTTSCTLQ